MAKGEIDEFARFREPHYWLRSKIVCRECGHEWTATYYAGTVPPPILWECPNCHKEHTGSIRSAADSEIYGTLWCERCHREFDRCEMRPGVHFPIRCPHCGRKSLRLHPKVRRYS
jgi:DNA-directed RNA polymerase subunit RPC12/RpoP